MSAKGPSWGLDPLWESYTRISIGALNGLKPVDPATPYILSLPGGRAVERFRVLGDVVSVKWKSSSTLLEFRIDDGTGLLLCSWWMTSKFGDSPFVSVEEIKLGRLMHVGGKFQTYNDDVQLVVSYVSPEKDRNAEPLFWLEMLHLFGAEGGYCDARPVQQQRSDAAAKRDAWKKQKVDAGPGDGGQAGGSVESALTVAMKAYVRREKVFLFARMSEDAEVMEAAQEVIDKLKEAKKDKEASEAAKKDKEDSKMTPTPKQLMGQTLLKLRDAGVVYQKNEQTDEWGELSLESDVMPFCEGVVRTQQEAGGGRGCHITEVLKWAKHAPKMGGLAREVVQRAMDLLEEKSTVYASDRGEYKLVPGGG